MRCEYRTVDLRPIDLRFIGGSDAWRASDRPWRCIAEFRHDEKPVHWGRCTGRGKTLMMHAHRIQSVDGNSSTRAPDTTLPRVLAWLDATDRTPALPLPDAPPLDAALHDLGRDAGEHGPTTGARADWGARRWRWAR